MCGSKPKVKETAEEKALARISKERWDSYKQRYIPIENAMMKKTLDRLNKPDELIGGMANASTQMQYSALEPQVTKGLTLRGAKAGSGAFTGAVTGLVRDRTKSSAGGQISGQMYSTAMDINNLQNFVKMGQGQADASLQGYASAADFAQRQAILDAQASAAARAAVGQAIGTGVGMAYGNYSNPAPQAPAGAGLTYTPTNGTYQQPGVALVATGPKTLPGY